MLAVTHRSSEQRGGWVPRILTCVTGTSSPAIRIRAQDTTSQLHRPFRLAKGSASRVSLGPRRRGCSSDGRALQSHCRGQGFDSPQLHQPPQATEKRLEPRKTKAFYKRLLRCNPDVATCACAAGRSTYCPAAPWRPPFTPKHMGALRHANGAIAGPRRLGAWGAIEDGQKACSMTRQTRSTSVSVMSTKYGRPKVCRASISVTGSARRGSSAKAD